MNPSIIRHIIFPLYHVFRHTGLIERIRESEENQWKTREELIRIQEDKLRCLLEHAYRNVPFYRQRFDASGIHPADLRSPEAFAQVPLLTKNEINANREEIVARDASSHKLMPSSTSGSTGEALRFYSDFRSRICRQASLIVHQRWMGIYIGDRTAKLWGAAMDIRRSRRMRERLHGWLMNSFLLASYYMSDANMAVYVERLNRFRPAMVLSYPGPLSTLSEYLIEVNKSIWSLKAIVSSAETLHSWQKEVIERAFPGVPIYNRYGCREFGNFGYECDRHEGMHVDVGRVVLEVVNEKGAPVPKGQSGEIVITDLDNYGMPMIRYRIGDIGSFSETTCSCGRRLPMLKSVEGRTLDIVVAPNGNRLGGTFWTLLFRSRPGIRIFQVVQDEVDHITVNYVPDSDTSAIQLDFFTRTIQEKCGLEMRLNFHQVSSIPTTTSGKTRFVISSLRKTSRAEQQQQSKYVTMSQEA